MSRNDDRQAQGRRCCRRTAVARRCGRRRHGVRPPTPAMKRFADSVARQKGIKPPPGYTKSGTICRAFLDQHAPKKADMNPRESWLQTATPAQVSLAEKIAREQGIVIPDESKASSAAMSAWIKSHLHIARAKGPRKSAHKPAKPTMPKSPVPAKRPRCTNSEFRFAPPAPGPPKKQAHHKQSGSPRTRPAANSALASRLIRNRLIGTANVFPMETHVDYCPKCKGAIAPASAGRLCVPIGAEPIWTTGSAKHLCGSKLAGEIHSVEWRLLVHRPRQRRQYCGDQLGTDLVP